MRKNHISQRNIVHVYFCVDTAQLHSDVPHTLGHLTSLGLIYQSSFVPIVSHFKDFTSAELMKMQQYYELFCTNKLLLLLGLGALDCAWIFLISFFVINEIIPDKKTLICKIFLKIAHV